MIGIIRLIHRSSVVETGTGSHPEFSDSTFHNKLKKKLKKNPCTYLTIVVNAIPESSPNFEKARKCVMTKRVKDHVSMIVYLVKNKDSTLRLCIGQRVASLTTFFHRILNTFNFHFYLDLNIRKKMQILACAKFGLSPTPINPTLWLPVLWGVQIPVPRRHYSAWNQLLLPWSKLLDQ